MTNNETPMSESTGWVLGSALYDKLKLFVQIVLPALSTLYFTLGNIWGWSYVEQVIGTIAAFTVFFGVVLRISTVTYNNSTLKYQGIMNIINQPDGKKTYSMVFDGELDNIDQRDEVTFKVFNRDVDE